MKNVAVLGSTGSVGENALRVIESAPDRFRVVGLAAGANFERMAEQIKTHRPRLASLCSNEQSGSLCALLGNDMPEAVAGEEGLVRVAAMEEADLVLIAVSGAAALEPAFAAVRAGKTVALANKECLVMAGELIMAEAEKSGSAVIPVDSEHSGVFQALAGRPVEDVSRILLPASGGPFLDAKPEELESVTPERALDHPTWSMGKKISIDSATMMNKALEIIEARWLFGIEPERIEVIIHPQSVVHAMVEFKDGSVVAQMSVPDMRLPILHALAWPDRIATDLPRLDPAKHGPLEFRALDRKRFPAPDLAYQALSKGGTATAAFAAADEESVEAFLQGRMKFNRIVNIVAEVLESHSPQKLDSIEAARKADAWAREQVRKKTGRTA